MPTYEYQCKRCGTIIDHFQSISARPLKKLECPTCAAVRPVDRLISTGGGLIFKGSGFYLTDYRSDSYKQAAKSESDSAKPADKSAADAGTKPADGAKAKSDAPTAEKSPAKSGDAPASEATKPAAPKARSSRARGKRR